MSDEPPPPNAPTRSFFEGRLIIDILSWDWNLRVAINPAAMRSRSRFQGLDYGRDFTIQGRIRAPRGLRGKAIKVTLSPFGPKVRFGRGGLGQIGTLEALPTGAEHDFEATLMLPEDAIATTATSLASIWRHVQIHTFDEDLQGAKVSSLFFCAAIPPDLEA
jgi:hypothetical protein